MLPDTRIYACVYVCVSPSACVFISIRIYVCVPCLRGFVCALLAISVFVCPTVYGHICISPDDAAVNFFGVTENDLELMLLVNVSDSGNGSRCVCVCVCMHNERKLYWMLSTLSKL